MSIRVSGHYVPVAARREVLRIYRDRRVRGNRPIDQRAPVSPQEAMWFTKDYFTGWLAHDVAFGRLGRTTVQDRVDQVRAAE